MSTETREELITLAEQLITEQLTKNPTTQFQTSDLENKTYFKSQGVVSETIFMLALNRLLQAGTIRFTQEDAWLVTLNRAVATQE